MSVRITARFPAPTPSWRRSWRAAAPGTSPLPGGLAPRALRDLQRAREAGRFRFDDPAVALACTGGALFAVLHLALERHMSAPRWTGRPTAWR